MKAMLDTRHMIDMRHMLDTRHMLDHSSSKATKNESSCPDKIPLQMLPMGMWGPENMKIKNI